MLHRSHFFLLALLLFVLPLHQRAAASALPPNIQASRSPNGRFLVLTDNQYDSPDETAVRHILQTTYRVFQLEPFINSKDHLVASVPFWSDGALGWSVTMRAGDEHFGYYWPMVNDDGLSLTLVSVTWPILKSPVLLTYHQSGFRKAQLVRAFTIADLWNDHETQLAGNRMTMATDSSPLWFAGGSFDYSLDGHALLYRNQWGRSVRIDLTTGVLTAP